MSLRLYSRGVDPLALYDIQAGKAEMGMNASSAATLAEPVFP